jgi:plasmid stabilization system protein ParE
MIRRVIVRPLALEDVSEAATWYEEQCPGLGEELADEVVKAIRRAGESPELFRVLRPRDGMRRVLTERFPYRIFFSIVGEALYVHAVLHGCAARSPMAGAIVETRSRESALPHRPLGAIRRPSFPWCP